MNYPLRVVEIRSGGEEEEEDTTEEASAAAAAEEQVWLLTLFFLSSLFHKLNTFPLFTIRKAARS